MRRISVYKRDGAWIEATVEASTDAEAERIVHWLAGRFLLPRGLRWLSLLPPAVWRRGRWAGREER